MTIGSAPERHERDDFLNTRARVGLWTVFIAVLALSIQDFLLPNRGAVALHLLRVLELALVAGGAAIVRSRPRRKVLIVAAVTFVSLVYVCSALTGFFRDDAQTQLVTGLALAFGTAATLPWGLWPQLVSVLVASASATIGWYLVHGTLAGADLHLTTGIAIAFLTSLYIAWQLHRYRTERDDAERALHASMRELAEARDAALEATRAKSAFLANTSHEIRTPMNVIVGMTDMALDTRLEPEARDCLGRVRAAASALLQIINDILDLSKIEAGRIELEAEPLDARATVAEVVRLLAPTAMAKRIALEWRIDPGVPGVLSGDPGKLRQVLINLIGNAIKFTERGGVLIEVQLVYETPLHAGVRFAVRDTGIGIPPDRQAAVFESFTQVYDATTRQYGGTGLGLTISRQLVELMGGELRVDSTVGVGSTFSFSLPLARTFRAGKRSTPAAA